MTLKSHKPFSPTVQKWMFFFIPFCLKCSNQMKSSCLRTSWDKRKTITNIKRFSMKMSQWMENNFILISIQFRENCLNAFKYCFENLWMKTSERNSDQFPICWMANTHHSLEVDVLYHHWNCFLLISLNLCRFFFSSRNWLVQFTFSLNISLIMAIPTFLYAVAVVTILSFILLSMAMG